MHRRKAKSLQRQARVLQRPGRIGQEQLQVMLRLPVCKLVDGPKSQIGRKKAKTTPDNQTMSQALTLRLCGVLILMNGYVCSVNMRSSAEDWRLHDAKEVIIEDDGKERDDSVKLKQEGRESRFRVLQAMLRTIERRTTTSHF